VLDAARRFDAEARAELGAMVALAGAARRGVLLVANKADLLRGVALDARQRSLAAAVRPAPRGTVGGWPAAVADADAAAAGADADDGDEDGGGGSGGGGGGGSALGYARGGSDGGGRSDAALAGLSPREARRPGAAPRAPRRDLLGLKLDVAAEWLEGECRRAGLVGPGGFAAERAGVGTGARAGAAAGGGPADEAPLPASALYGRAPPLFCLSAARGHGVAELRAALLALAPRRAWAFDAAAATDQPLLARVAEAVREQLLHRLHAEVPYRLRQETRSWREVPAEPRGEGGRPPRAAFTEIHQDIHVPSQRAAAMLLAGGGAAIRDVAAGARETVAALLGARVRLVLHVSVKSDEDLRRSAERSGDGGA